MTPRVLGREIEVARLRSIDDYRRDVTQAHSFARCYALVRSKNGLPPVSELLSDVKDGPAHNCDQSPTELLGAVQIMSGMYGIPMRRASK